MDPIAVGSVVASTLALVGYVAYQVSIGRELRQARKETSRFPLFAARDALLELVGNEKMSESDLAWRNMYRAINHLLCLDNEWHALDVLLQYARASASMASDPARKQRFEAAMKQEREAAEKVPEYASLRESVDVAFRHLIRQRTRAWHGVAILGIRLIALAVSAGLSEAKRTTAKLREPSGRSYRGWLAANEGLRAAA